MPRPRLTVITVTFNAREGFLQTLESVSCQSWRDRLEYLVIDGGSRDGTLEAIRLAAGRGAVDSWLSEPDRGIYDAMNKGTLRANGDYILFLNAGDRFPKPDTVERFLEPVKDRPGFLWGDSEVDRDGRILPDPAAHMLRYLYRQMTVCHQSLAVRADLLRAHPFDLELRVAADYEVLCRLVSEGERGQYCPVVVSRVLDEGFSSRNFTLGLEEKQRVSRRYFPNRRWQSGVYFRVWELYMRWKDLLKTARMGR